MAEESWVYCDEFVVGDGGIELGWERAPRGEYLFVFVLADVHQLATCPEFVAVEYFGAGE
ncbi:MAG: hypothetical protein IMW98_09640 [Firmicutes bacterium]|nr:hypothetical protein [Bacillota bacterium]